MKKNCVQCGKCCHFMTKEGLKPCKFLLIIDGKTKCKVYRTRLGRLIFYGDSNFPAMICSQRKMTDTDFKGCPLNTNKPIVF